MDFGHSFLRQAADLLLNAVFINSLYLCHVYYRFINQISLSFPQNHISRQFPEFQSGRNGDHDNRIEPAFIERVALDNKAGPSADRL